METRSQRYAKRAYGKIIAIQHYPEVDSYSSFALSFPVMILQSGLAQASGFALAKANEAQKRYLNDLADILSLVDAGILHKEIIESDLAKYRDLTRRSLEAAGWLKRYAQGLLSAENSVGDQR